MNKMLLFYLQRHARYHIINIQEDGHLIHRTDKLNSYYTGMYKPDEGLLFC